MPDTDQSRYDPRTDAGQFVMEQGIRFEAGVMRLLAEREEVRTIAAGGQDAVSAAHAAATIVAMREGVPIIAQGVLRDPVREVYGIADLLVRADVLASMFFDALPEAEAIRPAPALGTAWHYRIVDIKFHTFALLRDGHVSTDADTLPFAVQVWLYNQALGEAQGFVPGASFLLGRNWTAGADERGSGCLERLARVDTERMVPSRGATIEDLATGAVDWIRRLRSQGSEWSVLPLPSVPELYPHMRNADDAPWHGAKATIAARVGELTVLPRVNPDRRAAAHAAGLRRNDDPALSAARLAVSTELGARQLDAVLAANRGGPPVVLPERITRADPSWRAQAPIEFFVDFETTSNLADDFSRLPAVGEGALIFQVGCGHLDGAGTWRFAQFTADRLTPDHERRVLDDWIAHMRSVSAGAGITLDDARLYHWSPAETSTLNDAYNAARTRHPDAGWPEAEAIRWFDLLINLARFEPITVTGAFGFGLKAIAKAMHAQGFIATVWGDGPTDGLGAMIGAFHANAEAIERDIPMTETDLMREIAAYNEVDCRVMAEVLAWLRANR